ncbi:hypothetical protein AVEN_207861-1 [Araneus ventricosus]|uniref:Uncharacterized protein n=1 Tax=Araneus ventricosus TaxID=182803 RepID=A0A4Y2KQ32_ARAVE|nr:hypothetical protein AVEN_207861-1 [Araneus ventricosus]
MKCGRRNISTSPSCPPEDNKQPVTRGLPPLRSIARYELEDEEEAMLTPAREGGTLGRQDRRSIDMPRSEAANLWYAYPWGYAKDHLGVREIKVVNGGSERA